jgi:hypothetical protein
MPFSRVAALHPYQPCMGVAMLQTALMQFYDQTRLA